MTDFSKTKLHCSSLYSIMGGKIDKKSNLDWYNSHVESLELWKAKYEEIPEEKRELKKSKNVLEKIIHYENKVLEFELIKDEEPLSAGCMSHLKKIYCREKYGKWSAAAEKGNKYTEKGTLAEQDSIDLYCQLRGVQLLKNEDRIENDYLSGHPDLYLGEDITNAEYIIDIKTPYDIETYMKNLGKDLNPAYWWQIQGYLALTGAKIGEVAYCLTNTPEYVLNYEKQKLFNRLEVPTDDNPLYKEKEKELINNMTFDDVPLEDRVIRYIVERDDAAIDKIYRKVEKCREYLAEIEELHQQRIFFAIKAGEMEEVLEEEE